MERVVTWSLSVVIGWWLFASASPVRAETFRLRNIQDCGPQLVECYHVLGSLSYWPRLTLRMNTPRDGKSPLRWCKFEPPCTIAIIVEVSK